MPINPPVIADNHGDLLIFESVSKAEAYIEAIDVLNNEYVLYDSEGRLLDAFAASEHGPVRITDGESPPAIRMIFGKG